MFLGLQFDVLAQGAKRISKKKAKEDLLFVLDLLKDKYAYWDRVGFGIEELKKHFLPKINKVKKRRDLVRLFEEITYEFYDDHMNLNVNLSDSWRLSPSYLPLWAEFKNDEAFISEVREPYLAKFFQIKPGNKIIKINGTNPKDAVDEFLKDHLCQQCIEARNWALRKVLCGRYNKNTEIEIEGKDTILDIKLATIIPKRLDSQTLISHQNFDGGIAYLRICNSLSEYQLIEEFDALLEGEKNSNALILDLRDTPGGGNTTVAKGIMGRFVETEKVFQKYFYPKGLSDYDIRTGSYDIVCPRKKFVYKAPVVVLIGHWTGSMGEGMAIGFDAIIGSPTFGTSMAGLLGATEDFLIPNLNITIAIPTQKTFHINGTPRENFNPTHVLNLFEATQNQDYSYDAVLDGALVLIRGQSK